MTLEKAFCGIHKMNYFVASGCPQCVRCGAVAVKCGRYYVDADKLTRGNPCTLLVGHDGECKNDDGVWFWPNRDLRGYVVAERAGDNVNHPAHYNKHPSGIECIDVIEHMPHNIGAAIKYLWRAPFKHDDPIEDYRKAVWYINREIARLQREPKR